MKGRSDDLVLLRLLEAHCVPIAIITYADYAIETIHVSNRDEKTFAKSSPYISEALWPSLFRDFNKLATCTWPSHMGTISLASPRLLVACYATLHPALSVRRSVGGPLFTFSAFAALNRRATLCCVNKCRMNCATF